MRRSCLALACLALYLMEARAQTPPVTTTTAPSDAEIRSLLVDRIDLQKRSVGIVVGVLEPQKRRIVSYGSLEKADKRPLDGQKESEIYRGCDL
jgi:hypothetical protein